jgi:hypothetical protein
MVSVSLAGLTCRVNPYSRLPGALGPSSSPRRGLGASFFVAHLGPWHWFSLMGTVLPFKIITYAVWVVYPIAADNSIGPKIR